MNRRNFISTTALGALSAPSLLKGESGGESSSIDSDPLRSGQISLVGKLVHECSISGETRGKQVYPAHPNGIRLSKDRVLLLYATRGWRGVDEDRSIIYQVRLGGFTGPILTEGILAQSRDDWDPFNDGSRYFQAHGHPCGFGVPKGALIDGKPVPHANLFVIKWYSYSRYFQQPGRLALTTSDPASVKLSDRTIHMEWVHVRLNEAENDIEVVEPMTTLQVPGTSETDLSATKVNQTYVQPAPYNDQATEWIDMSVISPSERPKEDAVGPVAVKYRYNAARHCYEWVQAGERLFPPGIHAVEGGAIRTADGWAMFARPMRWNKLPLLWAMKEDPFDGNPPRRVLASPREGQPIVRSPTTVYRCADGMLRAFSGSADFSPYHNRRNPMYAWEVDESSNMALTRRQLIMDALSADLDIREEAEPILDMAKVLPHCGGSSQYIVFRVHVGSLNYERIRKNVLSTDRAHRLPAITEKERMACGIYVARIDYGYDLPGEWDFA